MIQMKDYELDVEAVRQPVKNVEKNDRIGAAGDRRSHAVTSR